MLHDEGIRVSQKNGRVARAGQRGHDGVGEWRKRPADRPRPSDFFFTNATILMRGVLVSGGGRTVVWSFGDTGTTGWASLQAPSDPATGEPYPIDSVSFCFNYDLYLNPNAYASIQRHWIWDIEKTGPTTPLTLFPGQSQPASYSVTVTPALSPDVSFVVQGPVFVTNSTPYETTVQQVTVALQQMTDTDGNGVLDFEVAAVEQLNFVDATVDVDAQGFWTTVRQQHMAGYGDCEEPDADVYGSVQERWLAVVRGLQEPGGLRELRQHPR